MQIPVPQNRLVALTIAGMVLTGALGVALASPSLLSEDVDDGGTDAPSAAIDSDAPTPNAAFTPAVQSQGFGGEEHEEYEEHEAYGEDEHGANGEHEADERRADAEDDQDDHEPEAYDERGEDGYEDDD